MIKHYKLIDETLKSKLYDLVLACNTHDNCNQPYMLDNEFELFEDLPKFFVFEIDDIIIAFASIYFIDDSSVYIYGFTHPEHRKKGLMKQLLQNILNSLIPDGITNFLIPISEDNKNGFDFMEKINASLSSTECLMVCALDNYTESSYYDDVQLLHLSKEDILEFSLQLYPNTNTAKTIGNLSCFSDNSSAAIFDVEIHPEYRGKGYGTKLLALVQAYLKKNYYKSLMLHVTKDNIPAYKLYKAQGFTEKETLCYFLYNY